MRSNALPLTDQLPIDLPEDQLTCAHLSAGPLPQDRAAHDWYRFVLSFPPYLVRRYLARFGMTGRDRVLDPFCGTGTTLVECRKQGIPSVGIEAHPMAWFASQVKVDWSPDPNKLLEHANRVANLALSQLRSEGVEDAHLGGIRAERPLSLRTLPPEQQALLLKNSISKLPLHKALVLLDALTSLKDEGLHRHELLALAKTLVTCVGNLRFGPEVGVGIVKADSPVVSPWLAAIRGMAADLSALRRIACKTPVCLYQADAREIDKVLEPNSVDAVITSPPYPNEKDYTRTTRLESVVLGFIRDKDGLRQAKRKLVRSNTRGVFKEDDDDRWVASHPVIQHLSQAIEKRRVELGKTSGFERLYPKVVTLYFGGMARHLAGLRRVLRPGARLAYVVGDQASYLRIMIRTGEILADIGRSLGYEVTGIDLFRTRLATATREHLREEVVVFRWPG